MNFRFSNGIVQISLPDVVEIVADTPEEAEEDYMIILRENGEITAFTAMGELDLEPRLSCIHRTFACRDGTSE